MPPQRIVSACVGLTGRLRCAQARVYDDKVREFVLSTGIENIGKRLVNSRDGKVEFEKPEMKLETLLDYGNLLVQEQENVKRVQLADAYLSGAELAGARPDPHALLWSTVMLARCARQVVCRLAACYHWQPAAAAVLR